MFDSPPTPIRQIGFIVDDLSAALATWIAAGAGPFFVSTDIQPVDFEHLGSPAPAPVIDVALGQLGEVQIELIAQQTDDPSIWRLPPGRDPLAVHHVSPWLDAVEFDARLRDAVEAGRTIVQRGRFAGSGLRFAYLDGDGMFLEMADPIGRPIETRLRRIADAARGWDGSDPIRMPTA